MLQNKIIHSKQDPLFEQSKPSWHWICRIFPSQHYSTSKGKCAVIAQRAVSGIGIHMERHSDEILQLWRYIVVHSSFHLI